MLVGHHILFFKVFSRSHKHHPVTFVLISGNQVRHFVIHLNLSDIINVIVTIITMVFLVWNLFLLYLLHKLIDENKVYVKINLNIYTFPIRMAFEV